MFVQINRACTVISLYNSYFHWPITTQHGEITTEQLRLGALLILPVELFKPTRALMCFEPAKFIGNGHLCSHVLAGSLACVLGECSCKSRGNSGDESYFDRESGWSESRENLAVEAGFLVNVKTWWIRYISRSRLPFIEINSKTTVRRFFLLYGVPKVVPDKRKSR